jgi:orotidine-5'-phosphate decarboxylase
MGESSRRRLLTTFVEKLYAACKTTQSLVCVGLDVDPERMPIDDVAAFNRGIVDATRDYAAAYKPNFGFYEALGIPGLKALEATISHIRDTAPDAILLGDCKRGDIDSTDLFYARAMFEVWDLDAVTVSPYMGLDSIQPFLDYTDRGTFVLCRTSNKGGADVQDLTVTLDGEPMPVYQAVARHALRWNQHGNVGLVTGATYPEELTEVRKLCPGLPMLVPGVGAQGGDLANSVRFGLDAGFPNLLINASRSIIYAGRGEGDFRSAAGKAAENLRSAINRILAEEERGWSWS